MKQRIKDYFVEIKEDKFTKVKSVKCKHKIEWKGKALENKFMLTKDSYSNSLSMSIDYRHKDDVDSVFFGFTYSNSDGGYPGMTNIKMYLILDDDKTIELSEGSGFDHASQSSKVGDNYISVYIETAQLAVSMSDFIAIANAKKIEYSIRFGQGSLENVFTQNNLLIFKGFYNSTFDDDFDFEYLLKCIIEGKGINMNDQDDKLLEKIIYHIFLNEGKLSAAKKYREATNKDLNEALKYISKFEDKAKNELALKYHNPIEIFFFVENSFSIWFDDNIKSIERINNDTTGFWNKDIISQIDFNELKVGIRTNSGDLFPSLLIFPEALIYIKSNIIFQIYYNKFTSIDSKKSGLLGLGGSSILIEANNSTHRIDMNCSIGLAIIIVDFLKKKMIENKSKIESKSYLI